jgi:hypothetical protein
VYPAPQDDCHRRHRVPRSDRDKAHHCGIAHDPAFVARRVVDLIPDAPLRALLLAGLAQSLPL